MSQPGSRRAKPSSRAAEAKRELDAARQRAGKHQQAAARARSRAAAEGADGDSKAAAGATNAAGATKAAGDGKAPAKATPAPAKAGGANARTLGPEARGPVADGQASLVAALGGGLAPPPAPAEEGAGDLPADRYLDREESWLRFAQRVLELAEDTRVPLLERVRFESIFASAVDEFFGVRVAGRMRRMATGLPVENASGKSSEEILANVLELYRDLSARHARCFSQALLPDLATEGIEILRWKELVPAEQSQLERLFKERIFPVLTPLAVDPAHPFPFISGLSLSLALTIADPRTGATMFARVKVPPLLPRFLKVAPNRFVPLEDVIAAHLGELFVGLDILETYSFRVTRITDLEIDEDVTEDLLKSLERELLRRRFEPAVRLEVEESMSDDVLERLVTELDVDRRAVYRLPGPLDLSGLSEIADLDIRRLKYPRFVPSESALPMEINDGSVFAALTEQDVLVHHPYDSFTASVQRLIVSAAADSRVLAIKQTLYRTSGDSEIVDALIDAAEAGKQVVVVVEIKARGDERANIGWVHKLEQAGCHVVYGMLGLKTHCKLALVVREEPDGSLRRFCHIGTGNYHPKTARLYEDFGLLTADRGVGEDIAYLFNHLTGYSRKTDYRRLLVAPEGVRQGLLERIEGQIARRRAGRAALIQMKCNSLIDEQIIDALYRASIAGVPVDLWIRGICALRPGVAGLSDQIRVRSVVGRFLEHSRIYSFGPGEHDVSDEVWIGSADMMHRNLDRRVEALVRVSDEQQQVQLRELFNLAMDSGTACWWLGGDGSWTRHHLDAEGRPLIDMQDLLIRSRRGRGADG